MKFKDIVIGSTVYLKKSRYSDYDVPYIVIGYRYPRRKRSHIRVILNNGLILSPSDLVDIPCRDCNQCKYHPRFNQ